MTREDRHALQMALVTAAVTLNEASKRVAAEQDQEARALLNRFAHEAEAVAEKGAVL